MKLRTGKYKGKTCELNQFANDWMSVDVGAAPVTLIVHPTQVIVEPEDLSRIEAEQHTGMFWDMFALSEDKTRFVRKPRE